MPACAPKSPNRCANATMREKLKTRTTSRILRRITRVRRGRSAVRATESNGMRDFIFAGVVGKAERRSRASSSGLRPYDGRTTTR